MKNINLTIENFGKIKKAEVEVKPFTIIAGKNGSGKSFITRSIYTLFHSLNDEHLSSPIEKYFQEIKNSIDNLIFESDQKIEFDYGEDESEALKKLLELRILINDLVLLLETDKYKKVVSKYIREESYKLLTKLSKLDKIIKNYQIYDIDFFTRITEIINNLFKCLADPNISFREHLQIKLESSFAENFQVTSLDKLKNKELPLEDHSIFDFGPEMGKLKLSSEGLDVGFSIKSSNSFQDIDNVLYLESPIYYKIKDALEGWVKYRSDPSLKRFKRQENELKKVPEYILNTFELLEARIANTKQDPKIIEIIKSISQGIGGGISISDSGSLSFNNKTKDGKSYSVDLQHAATGSVSLGIIGLLLEQNIIVAGSILVFDEPEVNLHPAWQQFMIQILYKLSLAGVYIVMASHSFDMMEAIEKLMDQHDPKTLDQHFSIIQLDDGNTINHKTNLFKKIDLVKGDLGMPLFNLMTE